MKLDDATLATYALSVVIGFVIALASPFALFALVLITGVAWFVVGRRRGWKVLRNVAVGLAVAIPLWTLTFQFRAS
jgi:hypothetical protein